MYVPKRMCWGRSVAVRNWGLSPPARIPASGVRWRVWAKWYIDFRTRGCGIAVKQVTSRGYNSGVYVRNSRDGAIWHQAQFGDAAGGYLFGETPTADGKKVFFSLDTEVKDMRVKPVGEWNILEMTARGKTLTLWVNGAVTCKFRDCGLEKGRVGLEGEGYRIEFRNLKVTELR